MFLFLVLIIITLSSNLFYEVASIPEFWLECNSSRYDCAVFDFEFVRSEGDPCKRVLCRAPSKPLEITHTPVTELSVMTYNVYETGPLIHTGQVERTCRIPATLASDYSHLDVIAFQELFYGGCWKYSGASMKDLLNYYGFKYITSNVGQHPSWPSPGYNNNGGIFIASRYPILHEKEMIFQTRDSNQYKGVMYAKIEKSDGNKKKVYHVFDSHLRCCQQRDSYSQVRRLQAIEWNAFINDLDIPADEPVIMAADFNMDFIYDSNHVLQMLSLLMLTTPPVASEQYPTWDTNTNDILQLQPFLNFRKPEYIDYVLPRIDYQKPVHAEQYIVRPQSKQPFRVCWRSQIGEIGYVWPDSDECIVTEEISDLADHYAVIGTFQYPE